MRLLVLLLTLPWWASLILLATLVIFVLGAMWYIKWKFNRIVREAVVDAGAALKEATAEVHSVKAVPPPAEPSPYDIDEQDEDFVPGVDDAGWDEPGTNFYGIEVTITPANPHAAWDPTGLILVPADYVPDDEIEITEKLCPLHSAQIMVNGQFRPAPEREVRGPQRLRMKFAVHEGLRAVKFALCVTYFGHVELPAPLPRQPDPRRPAGRT